MGGNRGEEMLTLCVDGCGMLCPTHHPSNPSLIYARSSRQNPQAIDQAHAARFFSRLVISFRASTS